jgi:hypothetical protein
MLLQPSCAVGQLDSTPATAGCYVAVTSAKPEKRNDLPPLISMRECAMACSCGLALLGVATACCSALPLQRVPRDATAGCEPALGCMGRACWPALRLLGA